MKNILVIMFFLGLNTILLFNIVGSIKEINRLDIKKNIECGSLIGYERCICENKYR